MLLNNIISLAFLCLFSIVSRCASVHSLKTLVVYDTRLTALEEYDLFFQSLKDRDFELDFKPINQEDTAQEIKFLSEDLHSNLYDNLIVFPIKAKRVAETITTSKLLKFFENGGDILAVTSPVGVTDPVRNFLNQLDIYPSPKGYFLRDYFIASDEKKNTFEISSFESLNDHVFDTKSAQEHGSLSYSKGSSALLGDSDLLVPILRAPATSVNKNTNDEEWSVGTQGYLVAGFQNLINSRLTWIGSEAFLSNAHFLENNGNFIKELTKWTFREKSVLKVVGAEHKHADGISYEEVPYKTTDEVVYDIFISEFKDNQWLPFEASDVQFELKMIDPYYRLTLSADEDVEHSKKFTTGVFKLPDHHGVFTFQVDYKRPGLSFIESKSTHAIRNLAHTEYARSWEITNAWVYLCSIYSVIALWLAFVVVFVFTSKKVITNPAAPSKKNQ